MPPEAVAQSAQVAMREFEQQYRLTTDGIIQWDIIPAETNAGNVNFLKVTIGKRDGTLFKSEEAANTYAEREYGLNYERYTTGKGEVESRPQEIVTNAAIELQDGRVFEGKNHLGALEAAKKELGSFDAVHEQVSRDSLFKTSRGRLVTRNEANKIAEEAKQFRTDRQIKETLIAEDLKPESRTTVRQGHNGGPVSFKTSKGSEYQVHADGTTTRNKSARPEHPGEQGLQPRSSATVYVNEKGQKALGEFQTKGSDKVVERLPDGRYGVKHTSGKSAGKFERRTVTDVKTEPDVGLYPVEVWDNGKKVHFGNQITEVNRGRNPNGGPPLEEDINTVPPVTVKQQGNGFYIQITKPLSEVDPLAREAVALPTNNREPISPANMLLGELRGAREVLPEFQNANRALTTYVPNQMRRLITDMVKPIGKLR
jgi:hypothetical protein